MKLHVKLVVLFILSAFIFSGCNNNGEISLIANVVMAEYGEELSYDAGDYVTATTPEALQECVLMLDEVDVYEEGSYEAKVIFDGKDYSFTVEVKDTIAPKATLIKEEFEIEAEEYLDIYDIYEDIEEPNEYSVYFVYGEVVVENDALWIEEVGEYNITTYVEDIVGNKTEFEIKVTVLEMGIPVIEGLTDIEWDVRKEAPDLLAGVTATDSRDGDLTGLIEVDDSGVDFDYDGIYELYYFVIDSDGHEGYEERRIRVIGNPRESEYVERTSIPVISGLSTMHINVGEQMPALETFMAGVTATDSVDGNITNRISLEIDDLDITQGGEYYIYYLVTNRAGEEAYGERLVIVIENEEIEEIEEEVPIETQEEPVE